MLICVHLYTYIYFFLFIRLQKHFEICAENTNTNEKQLYVEHTMIILWCAFNDQTYTAVVLCFDRK